MAASKVVEVICHGTPKEMGLAQGAGVENKIRAALRDLAKLEAFRLRQPRWLAYRIFRWVSQQRAWRFLAGPLRREYPAMSRAVEEVAKRYVDGADIKEGALNRIEAAIRAYDPCLSCSTHALGQMPLELVIVDAAGRELRRLAN